MKGNGPLAVEQREVPVVGIASDFCCAIAAGKLCTNWPSMWKSLHTHSLSVWPHKYTYTRGVTQPMAPPAGAIEQFRNNTARSARPPPRPPPNFVGMICEVRVWKGHRSTLDIQRDMNRTLTGKEPGLAAYYKVNEGYGHAVYDWCGDGRRCSLRRCEIHTPPVGAEWRHRVGGRTA